MAMLTCERELIIDVPAPDVWSWLSDPRNAMTLNQFHEGVDFDGGRAHKGLVVPIHHDVFGHRHIRLAHVSVYGDNVIGWGERLEDPDRVDTFPHSESWRVESLPGGRSLVRNSLRGAMKHGPLGRVLSPFLWSMAVPPILDADLQELAWKLGARPTPPDPPAIPPEHAVLSRLIAARTIDGEPVEKFLDELLPEGAVDIDE